MKRNVGPIDRFFRAFVLAPIAVVLALVFGVATGAGVAALAVAVILLATAAIKWCPILRLLGLNTCPVPQRRVMRTGTG